MLSLLNNRFLEGEEENWSINCVNNQHRQEKESQSSRIDQKLKNLPLKRNPPNIATQTLSLELFKDVLCTECENKLRK